MSDQIVTTPEPDAADAADAAEAAEVADVAPAAGAAMRSRAVRGAAWVAVERWVSRLLQIVVLAVLARYLGPSDLGVVALVAAIVGLLGAVSEFGLSAFLQSAETVDRRLESTAFWLNLALATAMAAVACLAAGLLIGDPFIRHVLQVAVLVLPVTAIASVPTALLLRELDTRPLAIRRLVGDGVGGVVAISTAVAGWGAWALVTQLMTAAVVSAIVLVGLSGWRPTRDFDGGDARRIMAFGSRVLGSQVTNQLRDRSDDFVLAAFLGTVALGAWTMATRLVKAVVDLTSTVILAVSLSSLASVSADRERLHRGMRAAFGVTCGVIFPAMGLLAVLAGPIISLVFGAGWQSAVGPAQFVTVALGIATLQWLEGSFWYSTGRPHIELRLAIGAAVFHVGLMIAAAALLRDLDHALLAFAAVYLARVLITVPVRVAVICRVGGLPLRAYADVPLVAVATAVMMTAVTLVVGASPDVDAVRIVVGGVVGLVTYLPVVALLRPVLVREITSTLRGAIGSRRASARSAPA